MRQFSENKKSFLHGSKSPLPEQAERLFFDVGRVKYSLPYPNAIALGKWIEYKREVSEPEDEGDILQYIIDCVVYWSGLDAETCAKIPSTDLRALFVLWNKKISEFKPTESEFVKIGKKKWYLPKENLEGGTFGEFADASQFEQNAPDGWEALPYVMAVLLRSSPGEAYDYTKTMERAEIMKKATIADAMLVGFFLLDAKSIFEQRFLTLLRNPPLRVRILRQ